MIRVDLNGPSFGICHAHLKSFEMPTLNVLKLSFPRPHPQGSLRDRDMHGAQVALLLETLDV